MWRFTKRKELTPLQFTRATILTLLSEGLFDELTALAKDPETSGEFEREIQYFAISVAMFYIINRLQTKHKMSLDEAVRTVIIQAFAEPIDDYGHFDYVMCLKRFRDYHPRFTQPTEMTTRENMGYIFAIQLLGVSADTPEAQFQEPRFLKAFQNLTKFGSGIYECVMREMKKFAEECTIIS